MHARGRALVCYGPHLHGVPSLVGQPLRRCLLRQELIICLLGKLSQNITHSPVVQRHSRAVCDAKHGAPRAGAGKRVPGAIHLLTGRPHVATSYFVR